MARRRSSRSRGRDPNRSLRTPRAPRPDAFDETWLAELTERTRSRFVDLTRYEDRRIWSPSVVGSYVRPSIPLRGLRGKPRIVVVPEGHRLQRFQTYGGKYSLKDVLRGPREFLLPRGSLIEEFKDKYGRRTLERTPHLSSKVGFALPWQVIICVRRKRRRRVIFSIGRAGKGGSFKKKVRRNDYSEVRC